MKVEMFRVKQYNSTYKTVVSVNGQPVCITKSRKRASEIMSYLYGYDVKISDGALKKRLDSALGKGV